MIVKDSAIYGELFGKANRELGLSPDLAITTIEDYFGHMRDLVLRDRRYAILPLDEPVFEINANTRTINIPNEFKLNGISVQGDESAEYIYFKINRFFDAQDFNEAKILIQWQAPGINNTPGDSGIDQEWVRDIESDPGKIIFGWRITSDITKNPGTIKFAIRFVITTKENLTDPDNEIVYSFSTLTASANIKPSLDFSIFNVKIDPIESNSDLELRFSNSTVVGGVPAAPPIFFTSFDENPYDIAKDEEFYTLKAQAYVEDTGVITYDWKMESSTEPLMSEDVYVQIEANDQFNDKKVYYSKSPEGEVPAYVPKKITTDSFKSEVKAGLYERYSYCNISSAGKYFVEATNKYGKASTKRKSGIATFPTPNEEKFIVNKLNVNKEHTIQETESGFEVPITASAVVENPDKELLSYEWYEVNDNENKIIEGENSNTFKASHIGKYFSKVYNTRNNVSVSKDSDVIWISLPAELPIIKPFEENAEYKVGTNINIYNNFEIESRSEHINIQWYKVVGATGGDDDVKIGELITDNFTLDTTGFAPGKYYFKMQNIYNGDKSEFVVSNTFDLYE